MILQLSKQYKIKIATNLLIAALTGTCSIAQTQPNTLQAPASTAPWEQTSTNAAPVGSNPALVPLTPVSSPSSNSLSPSSSSSPRAGQSLQLTQKAWENPNRNLGRGQSQPGYKQVQWNPTSVIQINTREGLITTVSIPEDDAIVQAIVSDPGSIEVATSPNKKALVIKPVYAGIDGNVVVYGNSGAIYTLYVRSAAYNASELSDVKVVIQGRSQANIQTDNKNENNSYIYQNSSMEKLDPSHSLTEARAGKVAPGKEFAAQALTGQGRLRNDLTILAANEASSIIAPVAAWRDDKFTYLDFGPRAASMNSWPVASLVVDNIESPVGTRVSGPNRSIMIIESLGNVVLRNGQHLICIKADFERNDPRSPTHDKVYQTSYRRPDKAAAVPEHVEPYVQNYKISTGPYTVDKALKLASEMQKGYGTRLNENQIKLGTDLEFLDKKNLLNLDQKTKIQVYVIKINHKQAETICSDLRHSGRKCKINQNQTESIR